MSDAGGSRIYLDTNIFIRVFEGRDEISEALARLFLRGLGNRRPKLATSELTLAELVVVPLRESNQTLLDVYQNWTISNPFIEARSVDRSVLWHAAVLRARYQSLKLQDAIHVATAIHMQCARLLTTDERLKDRYELADTRSGLTRVSGYVEIIRPEVPLLDGLLETSEQDRATDA